MPADEKLHALEIDGVSTAFELHSFEGHEGISQLFEFVVTIGTADALTASSVIRSKAKLSMRSAAAVAERDVHAVVSRVEEEAIQRTGAHQYRVTLVPWAWMLVHGADSRIFQDKNVPDIVKAVLTGAGYADGTDFKFSLRGTYATREYCVQYRESNWDFVCRLLEEEGIFFFFDAATGALVLADATAAIDPIAGESTLPYRPDLGAGRAEGVASHVARFRFSEEVRAGKVTLRDWDFLKPALKLESQTSASTDAKLELYDYPGEYVLPADGDAYAGLRLQELDAGRKIGEGDSECARLVPGHSFTLAEHPNDAFNASYLLTRVEHVGSNPTFQGRRGGGEQPVPYRNAFEVIPATVVFRPPRVTRRPHIHGVQTAIVVGPSGEEIYVDAQGRVKVQFHWDRLGKNDDKSSCWVRVAQTWASAAYGAMFLPRLSDEVVVAFIEGDPDRPLIVGSVYHGTNVPPYSLPGEKTKSTIKSNSSKGGGGSNELRFEDKKGSEEVYLHAQKDWTIKVENDKNQVVGHDETLEVDNDRTKTVKHDQTATVEHDDATTVKNDQTLTVQHDRSVTVQNDHTETVSGNQTISVTKAQSLTVSDKQDITVKSKRTLTVDDDVAETYKAKLTLAVTGDVAQTLKGKHGLDVTGDQTVKVGGKQSVTITGDSVESVTGKKSITVNGDVTITSGASTVTIKPSGEITIQGVKMTIDASGPLQLHGATVEVKADAQISLKAPIVNGAADGVHTVKGAVLNLDGQMVNVG
jgi:type VI secretion system secreted protein VgrG